MNKDQLMQRKNNWTLLILIPSILFITGCMDIDVNKPASSRVGESFKVEVIIVGYRQTYFGPSGYVYIEADTTCKGRLRYEEHVVVPVSTAKCSVTFNTPGNQTIKVIYNGDDTYNRFVKTVSHTVLPTEDTSTTLTLDPDPSFAGDNVNACVQVNGGTGSPTGSVAVSQVGGGISFNIALDQGQGCNEISFDSPGSYSFQAAYSGDDDFNPSDTTAGITISTYSCNMSIVADSEFYPMDVMVSATVNWSGEDEPWWGTNQWINNLDYVVKFTGADSDCQFSLIGILECQVSFDSVKSYTLAAELESNNPYVETCSDTLEINVVGFPTETSITTAEPDPNNTDLLLVHVEVTGGAPSPQGSVNVSFADGSSCDASLSPESSGDPERGTPTTSIGSCSITPPTTPGDYLLTADYPGDDLHLGNTGTWTYSADKYPTSIEITSVVKEGDNYRVSYLVNSTVPSPITAPSGTVTITGQDSGECIQQNTSGSCLVQLNSYRKTYALHADYSGDENYLSSQTTYNFTTPKLSSWIVFLDVSHAQSAPGESVRVEVQLDGMQDPDNPIIDGASGYVDIASQGSSCRTDYITPGGTGFCYLTFSSAGNYTIWAEYGGDEDYKDASATTSHKVKNPATPTDVPE